MIGPSAPKGPPVPIEMAEEIGFRMATGGGSDFAEQNRLDGLRDAVPADFFRSVTCEQADHQRAEDRGEDHGVAQVLRLGQSVPGRQLMKEGHVRNEGYQPDEHLGDEGADGTYRQGQGREDEHALVCAKIGQLIACLAFAMIGQSIHFGSGTKVSVDQDDEIISESDIIQAACWNQAQDWNGGTTPTLSTMKPKTTTQRSQVSQAEFEILAQFRYSLRQFLRFSELAARSAGLTPQQHQALLAIKGFPGLDSISVGQLADVFRSVTTARSNWWIACRPRDWLCESWRRATAARFLSVSLPAVNMFWKSFPPPIASNCTALFRNLSPF